MPNNSILDKIIKNKQQEEALRFNPSGLVNDLFKNLKDLEREVLYKRFGLVNTKPQTLEQIGKSHEITRERVRQIQNSAIKKIKTLNDINAKLNSVIRTINHLLQRYGGFLEESYFLENLLAYSEDTFENRQATLFITSQLLNDKIERIKSNIKTLSGWKLNLVDMDNINQTLNVLEQIIATQNRLLAQEEIINLFKNHEFFNTNRELFIPIGLSVEEVSQEDVDEIIYSYLKISQRINSNILNQWGLSDWQTVVPRRMGDKIYLVLKKHKKPLHFTEISNLINQTKFDTKIAYPATIHNELILDDRYVLVGRGIYALKEWGYQVGTVSEVIENILKNSGQPLTRGEILDAVLKERMVKKSTIYLALTNKNKFKKTPEGYILAQSATDIQA